MCPHPRGSQAETQSGSWASFGRGRPGQAPEHTVPAGLLDMVRATLRGEPDEDSVWERGGLCSRPGTAEQCSRDICRVLSESPGGLAHGSPLSWQRSLCPMGSWSVIVGAWSVRSSRGPAPGQGVSSALSSPCFPSRDTVSPQGRAQTWPHGLRASAAAPQPELTHPCMKRGDSVGASAGWTQGGVQEGAQDRTSRSGCR